jgi:hypothetical protein
MLIGRSSLRDWWASAGLPLARSRLEEMDAALSPPTNEGGPVEPPGSMSSLTVTQIGRGLKVPFRQQTDRLKPGDVWWVDLQLLPR